MTAPPAEDRRKSAVDLLCLAALVACQGWAAVSVVLVPAWLGTHPVALEAVNGGILSVAAAGAFVHAGHASLAAAWAMPLALWLPIDVVSWWAGRRFGARAVRWLTRSRPHSESAVRRSERFFDRHRVATVALAPWLPVPAALLYAVSGWRRLPLPMFIAADAVGTVARDGVVLWLGYTVGSEGVAVARGVTRFATWGTGTVVVILLAILLHRVLRSRPSAANGRAAVRRDIGMPRATASALTATRACYEAFPYVAGGPRRVRHWIHRLEGPLPDRLLRQGPVLDLGCGSGEITRGLAERKARTVSVDLTRAATLSTRHLNRGRPVCQADALALPFADDVFAHSVAIGVLHHTPDAAQGLREMSRVTRPGGRIVVLLYARWTPYHAVYMLSAQVRERIPVQRVDRTPRWVLAIMRLTVAGQVRQKLPDTQLKRLLADQLWTPRASFHSWRQLTRWAADLELAIAWRKRLACHANLVAFERRSIDQDSCAARHDMAS